MHKSLLFILALATLAVSCGSDADDNELDITSQFKLRWNVSENLTQNKDGSITYDAVRWGGMCANVDSEEGPADWSSYEKIVFEFANPTEVNTQIVIDGVMLAWGKTGITKLEAILMGRDMSKVRQVALQTHEATTIVVKRVWLHKSTSTWTNNNIWSGNCDFDNWTTNVTVEAEKFLNATPGDILEFIFDTDQSDPSITYWQIKTVINDEGANSLETATTLAGNANELNDWGCATMGNGARDYRITLTAADVRKLQEHGLFINGYHVILNRCNLLTQQASSDWQ